MTPRAPLQLARQYVGLGFSVIPCRPRSKKPALSSWKAYQTKPPSDQELEEWFSGGDANIAIVAGRVSGLVVVDVDSPEAKAWADEHLPKTPMGTRTASGEHRYFKHPGNGTKIGNRARIRTGHGKLALDLRADGGYCMAPGSVHPSGALYQRIGEWTPAALEALPTFDPAWVAEPERAAEDPATVRAKRATGSDRSDVLEQARRYAAGCDPAVSGNGGHSTTMGVVGAVVRGFDLSDVEALDALSEWNAGCQPPWSTQELRHKVAEAQKTPDPKGRVHGWLRRPRIVISTAIAEMVDRAEVALHGSSEPGPYRNAGRIVRVNRSSIGPPSIEAVPEAGLRERMASTARWLGVAKDGTLAPAMPPRIAVQALLARPTWRFPVLRGVVESPVLRPDDTVVDSPGYDDRTCLWLAFDASRFPAPRDRPTREQALKALAELEEVWIDFPFVEPCDRSAAVASMLTLVGRPAINGPAPLFACRATERGTGKSLWADTVAAFATGRVAQRIPHSDSDEEQRKLILSLGLEGRQLALFDNVERPLGSPALAAALTASIYSDRILGKSETKTVLLDGLTWLATGNNLTVKGDLGRRTLPIDLDAKVERPEARTGFRHPELLGYVRKNRGRLVTAALTILRAYAVSRTRVKVAPFGSFERWSKVVREPLVWLGRPDPCEGRKRMREDADPELEALRTALHAWRAAFGDEPVTLHQAIRRAKEEDELLEALLGIVPRRVTRETVDARSLGYSLRKLRGRIIDGLRFEQAGKARNKRLWRVAP